MKKWIAAGIVIGIGAAVAYRRQQQRIADQARRIAQLEKELNHAKGRTLGALGMKYLEEKWGLPYPEAKKKEDEERRRKRDERYRNASPRLKKRLDELRNEDELRRAAIHAKFNKKDEGDTDESK